MIRSITKPVLAISRTNLVEGAFNIQMFLLEWCQDADSNWGKHKEIMRKTLSMPLS